MEEVEVRQLFLIILNTYSGFQYDDDKVEIWVDILHDVPFELAQVNLRKYIRNAENKFPPHPGALAESAVQRSDGPYVLNAAETRLMLDERDREYNQKAIPMPDHIRERMKSLVQPKRAISGTAGPESTT